MGAITIHDVSKDTLEKAEKLAARQGVSVEEVVRRIVERALSIDPDQVARAARRMDELRAMTPKQASSVPILREVRDTHDAGG